MVLTDRLTASRQLDRCELSLVVFLKSRTKLGYKVRGVDRKGFDVCFRV